MSQQLFYVAMTGLSATMDQMTATTNNLANASTTGFKAQQPIFRAQPLYGQGLPDRVDVASAEDSANFKAGPIEETGRNLDVALTGPGWIGVQAADGRVVLTRNGSLSISATGVLQTSDGNPVLGRGGGPITLPPMQSVTIGQDGTISGVQVGQTPDAISTVNRIFLTNPSAKQLSRRPDGLFQDNAATPPVPDGSVKLQIGALEGSNANPVSLMMNMIENTRSFQMQTELMRMVVNATQGQNTPLSLT
jgi:flagellar basal-body rod protein FlgF